jgi:OmpA-OmpF porin, OOP family
MNRWLIFSLFFIVYQNTESQNLVMNPDFTIYFRCPQAFNQYNNNIKDLLPGWGTVNKSTPDFFHRCSQNSDVGVPDNFAGSAEPYSGDGYIGLILRVDAETYPFSATYSEHITGVLEKPLEKGKHYCLTFFYAFAENSGIITNGIGVYFSAEKPEFQDYEDKYQFQPQLMLHSDSMLGIKQGWNKLSAIYTAQGGEKYITIGNFLSVSESKVMKNNPKVMNDTRFFAYYFVDAVSLVEIESKKTCSCSALMTVVNNEQIEDSAQTVESGLLFEAGKTFTLKNVYFDFEKSALRPESFEELDQVVGFLLANVDVHVKIIGHTDNVGSSSYNQILSEERAKAVLEYLYTKGVALRRMLYEGKGCRVPVADNDTEWGRQQNRRVEVEFYIP